MGFGKYSNFDKTMKNGQSTIGVLLTALVLCTGCAKVGRFLISGQWLTEPPPDPLSGWTSLGSITWNGLKTPGERPPPLPDAVAKDYEDYIRKLPAVKGHFA